MLKTEILKRPLSLIIRDLPTVADFLDNFCLQKDDLTFNAVLDNIPESYWQKKGLSREEVTKMFMDFVEGTMKIQKSNEIRYMEVIAGIDKDREPEPCSLMLKPGEVTCIVGPTGSGKSRLLADIEWLANGDTPTQRKILINGKIPDDDLRTRLGGKLVAQITQNMNFVLDMDVQNFLLLHARSRFLEKPEEKVCEVVQLANELSGERFSSKTPVTLLSGGQSRALMIADVACIGQAPVILIDEIENAGVDKQKALGLLEKQEKIVLMATHDPLLILRAGQRIVIRNGGMQKMIKTNRAEKDFLLELEKIDGAIREARDFFRSGHSIQQDDRLTGKK